MAALLRRGEALKEKGELKMAQADLAVVLKMGQEYMQRVSFVFTVLCACSCLFGI